MGDALEFIQKRRSIRQYADAPVGDEQVETLLRAAMAAPSAGNEQAWAFVVIRDRARLDKVTEIHPYAQMCKTATAAILVCGDAGREKHEGMWPQDCSAAVQNLLLAAAHTGLGTCWCGVHPRADREQAFRDLCGIPSDVVPFALVAVGVPDEEKGPADYYDPSRVHHETWGQ
jgi:nitroreductase